MSLTPEQAAEIAARHGLGLADAASLRALADDPDQADRLAGQFATHADPMRRLVRDLFAAEEAPAPAPVPAEPTAPGNHVPREGSTTGGRPTSDEREARRFLASLFGRDPDLDTSPSTTPDTF
jgi:hypothetical protein